jgi:hypothetical protein
VTASRDVCLYQIRCRPDQTVSDLLGEMANVVWDTLRREVGPMPAERFTSLYRDLEAQWRRRLVHIPGCGERPQCRTVLRPALWDHPADVRFQWDAQGVHGIPRQNVTLECRGGLTCFVSKLSHMVFFRVRRRQARIDRERRRGTEARLMSALRGALAPYVYHSDHCRRCEYRAAHSPGAGRT